MTSEPGLISVYNAGSEPLHHKARCRATTGAITACADPDTLQDLIRQRCDAPD